MKIGASSFRNCPWIDSPLVKVFREVHAKVIRVKTVKPRNWNAKYASGMAAKEIHN